jgi:hypothetical protein
VVVEPPPVQEPTAMVVEPPAPTQPPEPESVETFDQWLNTVNILL